MDDQDLRDDQWEMIKPFVPGGLKGKRGPRSDGRRFFNALLWMARSGARWRDLPDRSVRTRQPSGASTGVWRWGCSSACSRR